MKFIFSLYALLIYTITLAQSTSSNVIPFTTYKMGEGKKYGLLNAEGKVILPATYVYIGTFKNGYAPFSTDDTSKMGYLNSEGIEVIPPIYQSSLFNNYASDGFIAIKKDNKYGYVNTSGEVIIEPTYVKAFPFHDGYAVVEKKYPGQRVVIDKTGKEIFNPKEFLGSYLKVNSTYLSYAIDEKVADGIIRITHYLHETAQESFYDVRTGKLLFPFKNMTCAHFSEDYCPCQQKQTNGTELIGYINKKGQTAIPFKFKVANLEMFRNGYAKVTDAASNRIGFINKKGTYVIQPQYSFTTNNYMEDAPFYVQDPKTYKYGYINSSGKPITEFIFRQANDFSNGLALVYEGLKFYYINTKGEKAFDLDFEYIDHESNFTNNLAKVKYQGKVSYINTKGEVVFVVEE